MHILLSTYWPMPHVGGVSTYVDTLRHRLENMGHEVEIFAQHPDLSKFYLLKGGQEIEKSELRVVAQAEIDKGFAKLALSPTSWIIDRETEKYTLEMAVRQLNLEKYDLIHTQDILSTFAFSRVKPHFIPLVATIHGCLATEWIANGEICMRSPIEREYLQVEEYFGAMSADCLILPSQWLADRLASLDITHPRQSIIPYGLDRHKFMKSLQQTSELPDRSHEHVIACPARLVAIKGQNYLLEALHQVVKLRQDVVCWLIGDGVMRKDLEKQAAQLNLDHFVQFLGDRFDVPALLSQADMVVLPSLQDNLPFAVMEAQTAGKPVIASNVGGIVEMIKDGENGFLVESRDSQQLSDKIILLLENSHLREQQSKAAEQWALSQWCGDLMAERIVSIYEKAINAADKRQNIESDSHSSIHYPDPLFASKLLERQTKLSHLASVPTPYTTIQGTVKLRERPSSSIRLHLLDITGIVLKTAKASQDGDFSFHSVQPGNYALTYASADGKSGTEQIRVTSAPCFITIDL